jgi:capsular polysaccharide transport system permease protein
VPKPAGGEAAGGAGLAAAAASAGAGEARGRTPTGGGRRRQRRFPTWLATIVLPTALAAGYYFGAAAPRYVSEARFVIQSVDRPQLEPQGALAMLAGVASPARQDQLMVRDHMLSADMVRALEARLPFRSMVIAPLPDLAWWLPEGSPMEWMVRRLRSVASVTYDDVSGISTLSVQAFGAEEAEALSRAMLDQATGFVNRVSSDLARDTLAFAEAEAVRAHAKVQEARNAMNALQASSLVLDPGAEGSLLVQQIAEIERQIGEATAELAGFQSYLKVDNPRIAVTRARIADLRRQADELRRQLGSNGNGTADLLLSFRGRQAELEFAEAAYRVAMSGLENARARAAREQKRLVLVVEPARPEWAALPSTSLSMLAVLGLSVAFHLVVTVGIAIVREHGGARG